MTTITTITKITTATTTIKNATITLTKEVRNICSFHESNYRSSYYCEVTEPIGRRMSNNNNNNKNNKINNSSNISI